MSFKLISGASTQLFAQEKVGPPKCPSTCQLLNNVDPVQEQPTPLVHLVVGGSVGRLAVRRSPPDVPLRGRVPHHTLVARAAPGLGACKRSGIQPISSLPGVSIPGARSSIFTCCIALSLPTLEGGGGGISQAASPDRVARAPLATMWVPPSNCRAYGAVHFLRTIPQMLWLNLQHLLYIMTRSPLHAQLSSSVCLKRRMSMGAPVLEDSANTGMCVPDCFGAPAHRALQA